MSWNSAAVHQPVPTEKQHVIIGDSLIRELAEIFVVGQTTAIFLGGALVAQVIKFRELENDNRVETLTLMKGTNDRGTQSPWR